MRIKKFFFLVSIFNIGMSPLFATVPIKTSIFKALASMPSFERVKTTKTSEYFLRVIPEQIIFPSNSYLALAQREKLDLALDILIDLVNDTRFRDAILNFTRRDGVMAFRRNFVWSDESIRYSNEEIYKLIMRGDELTVPGTLGEMNLNLKVAECSEHETSKSKIKKCHSWVGYTYPQKDSLIRGNWAIYKRLSVSEMLSNIVHEWLHLIGGFFHDEKDESLEDVPHAIGRIAGDLANQILKERSSCY